MPRKRWCFQLLSRVVLWLFVARNTNGHTTAVGTKLDSDDRTREGAVRLRRVTSNYGSKLALLLGISQRNISRA